MKTYFLIAIFGLLAFTSCKDHEDHLLTQPTVQIAQDSDFLDTRDSTVYKTVRIGDQIWMAENLKYALPNYSLDGCFTWNEKMPKLEDIKPDEEGIKNLILDIARDPQYEGWPIRFGTIDFSYSQSVETTIQQYERKRMTMQEVRAIIAQTNPQFDEVLKARILDYANTPAAKRAAGLQSFQKNEKKNDGYVAKYGFLYSHEAALKAVPEGWRLPSDEDWLKLEQNLGLSSSEAQLNEAWRGEGLAHLLEEGGAAQFNAIKAGSNVYRKEAGNSYLNKDNSWYYWTSTTYTLQDSIHVAMMRMSAPFTTKVWRGTCRLTNNYRPVLNSVRCVKDAK